MEMTMEQLELAIAKSVRPSQPTQTTEPATLNPTATREIDEILGSEQGVKALQSLFDLGKLTVPAQAQDGDEADDEAEMGNMLTDAVRSVDRIGGNTFPWGSALAGGAVGFVLNDLINGFVSATNDTGGKNMIRPLVKGGAAWATYSFGAPFVGKLPVTIAGALLLFSAADDLVDLTGANGVITRFVTWVRDLFSGFGGGNRFHQDYVPVYQDDYHQPALGAGYSGQGQFFPGLETSEESDRQRLFR